MGSVVGDLGLVFGGSWPWPWEFARSPCGGVGFSVQMHVHQENWGSKLSIRVNVRANAARPGRVPASGPMALG